MDREDLASVFRPLSDRKRIQAQVEETNGAIPTCRQKLILMYLRPSSVEEAVGQSETVPPDGEDESTHTMFTLPPAPSKGVEGALEKNTISGST